MAAPAEDTFKGKRDRAMLATLLYHGLRREELCKLKVRDIHTRQGTPHLKIQGKGEKIRYLPLNPHASRLIDLYLEASGHGDDRPSALFRPIKNNRSGTLDKHLDVASICRLIRHYGVLTGIAAEVDGLSVHAMRATAAANALEHEADIAKVQVWLGHASIATTRIYDRRGSRVEDGPTFRLRY